MKIPTRSSIRRHTPVLHGGKTFRNFGKKTLDFSSNISPAGIPKNVKSLLRQNLKNIEDYPDNDSSSLMMSLKKYTGLDKRNLVVGNGAIEIIYNFCFAFLSEKTPVLIPIPTFQEYETASKLNNSKISFFKTMDLSEEIDSFISKIPKNGCVFLCNPNNPTGKLISKKQILSIIKESKKLSTMVFVDECFIELVPDANESVIKYVKKFDNLFVLRSLTKSFGIPGIRIGYGAASKQIVEILQKIKIPWSINSLAQDAGVAALKNKSHLTKSKEIIKKESQFIKNKIAKLDGYECQNSSTNFILIKTKQDSKKIQNQLLKQNILIRDCKNFRGLDNHFIRIAIKSHKDNLKLVTALERIS